MSEYRCPICNAIVTIKPSDGQLENWVETRPWKKVECPRCNQLCEAPSWWARRQVEKRRKWWQGRQPTIHYVVQDPDEIKAQAAGRPYTPKANDLTSSSVTQQASGAGDRLAVGVAGLGAFSCMLWILIPVAIIVGVVIVLLLSL
jgi:hypothetical protein